MVRVRVSAVIDAPVDRVWEKIRDFNALPEWHPAIEKSHIEANRPSDSVGCIRNFDLTSGGNIREQLLALSDLETTFTYSILESPMPLSNYVATLSLRKVTNGNMTYAEWSAEFDVPAAEEVAHVEIIRGVFSSGLESLQRDFAG
jgi:hypothetical protein